MEQPVIDYGKMERNFDEGALGIDGAFEQIFILFCRLILLISYE
jgi:hypothetical protein